MEKYKNICDECNNTYVIATKSKDEPQFCPFCGEENKIPKDDSE